MLHFGIITTNFGKFMKTNIIVKIRQIKILILFNVLFLFFILNLSAQNKKHKPKYPIEDYKYEYQFQYPSIDCHYYYVQSESSTLKNDNNEITLFVRILDVNKNLDIDALGYIQLIVNDGDTISSSLENNIRIKIPRQSFRFNIFGIFTCGEKLKNKPVYIDNKNTNEVILTIVQGCIDLAIYHIKSKKELTINELQDICDDIIYGSKKSRLKKYKDYFIMIQL